MPDPVCHAQVVELAAGVNLLFAYLVNSVFAASAVGIAAAAPLTPSCSLRHIAHRAFSARDITCEQRHPNAGSSSSHD